MAPHSSTLAWRIPWTEEPGRLWSMGLLRVGHDWATSLSLHFHALEKEMATHSSILAWRIPGTGEPGGLPFVGSHRVRHDWSDLAAAVLSNCPWTEEVHLNVLNTNEESCCLKCFCLIHRWLQNNKSTWSWKPPGWLPSVSQRWLQKQPTKLVG